MPTIGYEDPYCENDRFAAANGMRLTEVADGYAVATMTVEDMHLNCLDIVHGGVYFALADLACGASVGYAKSGAVTLDSTGEFMASAQLGDTITAVARRTSETRRIVRIQVELTKQDGAQLCVFRFTNYKKSR